MSSKSNASHELSPAVGQRRMLVMGMTCLAALLIAHLSVSISGAFTSPGNAIYSNPCGDGTCSATELGQASGGKGAGAGGAGAGGDNRLGGEVSIPVSSPSVSSGGVDLRQLLMLKSNGNPFDAINDLRVEPQSNGDVELVTECSIIPFTPSGGLLAAPANSPLEMVSVAGGYACTHKATGSKFEFTHALNGAYYLAKKTNGNGVGWTFTLEPTFNKVSAALSQHFEVEYEYNGVSGNIVSMTVKSTATSSPVLQRTDYYYSGTNNNGADLLQVKHTDASGNERFRQFRYDGSARPKTVLEPSDIQAVIASNSGINTPAQVRSAADSVVNQHASKRIEYYTGQPTSTSALEDLYGADGGLDTSALDIAKTIYTKGSGGGGCCGGGGSGAAAIRTDFYYLTNELEQDDDSDVTRIIVANKKDASGQLFRREIAGLDNEGYEHVRAVTEGNLNQRYWCNSWLYKPMLTVPVTGSNQAYNVQRYKSEYRMPSAHNVNNAIDLAELLDNVGDKAHAVFKANDGLTYEYEYDSDWNQTGVLVRKGTAAANYISAADFPTYGQSGRPSATYTYTAATTNRNDNASRRRTAYAYTFHDSGNTRVDRITTTLATVTTAKNGSNVATVTEQHFDQVGNLIKTVDGEGYSHVSTYHPAHNGMATRRVDSTGKNLTTTYQYDDIGRVIMETEPGGAQHRTVYKPDQVLRFPYWNTSNRQPIQVSKLDDAGRVTDSITVNPAFVTGGANPTGFLDYRPGYITWTKNVYASNGALSAVLRYHNIPSGDGFPGLNFYPTKYHYDDQGRPHQTAQYVDANRWQWTQTVYDDLGRAIETRRKRHTNGDTAPTGMARVSYTVYDNRTVGDGYVTHQLSYHGTGNTANTGTRSYYDYRGRMRGSHHIYASNVGTGGGNISPHNVVDLDWEGNAIATATFSYLGTSTWNSIAAGSNYASTQSYHRKRYSTSFYDELGRQYRTERYLLNSQSSTLRLRTDRFFDRNGKVVAIAPAYAAATEMAYDGAGRRYQTRTVRILNGGKYSAGKFNYQSPAPEPDHGSSSNTMTDGDDSVIEISHQLLDEDGNAVESHSYEINHNDTNGLNLSGSDWVRRSIYNFYDDANRLTHSVDNGSGTTIWANASMPAMPANLPTASTSSYLVTRHAYYSHSGRLQSTVDPKGTVTKNWYDDLGRTTFVASNWKNLTADGATHTSSGTGGSDKSQDATVETVYNGNNSVKELKALDRDGNGNTNDNEVTKYFFEDLYNTSLATHTVHPDSTATATAGANKVTVAYALDGRPTSRTDQRGTRIDYTYNNRRETDKERVITLGGPTDGYVRSIKRFRDALGQVYLVRSYAGNNANGAIRNAVRRVFDNLGRVTYSYQDHNGHSYTSTTPRVLYFYDVQNSGGVLNHHARHYITRYPSLKQVYFDTGASNTIDRALNRTTRIGSNHTGPILSHSAYKYSGAGRLVETNYEQSNVVSTSDTASGAGYEGWDRFGRTKVKQWKKGATTLDKFTYDYDYASNRTVRDNALSTTLDQTYNYDGGHRLDSYTEGSSIEQDWSLDAWGNWEQFKYDHDNNNGTGLLTQSRLHNDANEIGLISNWSNPGHDAAGNMTSTPDPNNPGSAMTLVYDAWNRLVKAGTTYYRYDGLNRRVVKDLAGGSTNDEHYYYNTKWQCLEVRTGSETGTRKEANVWHPGYVDSLAGRYRDTTSNGYSGDEIQYVLQDANFNVTALSNSSGSVLERYHYSAYGDLTVLNPNFTLDTSGSDYASSYTYTGRRFDQETGLYQYRNRYYHAQLGRFTKRDPIGFEGSKWNLYEYVTSRPTIASDPLGLVGLHDYGPGSGGNPPPAGGGACPKGPCGTAGPDVTQAVKQAMLRLKDKLDKLPAAELESACKKAWSAGGWDIPILAGKNGGGTGCCKGVAMYAGKPHRAENINYVLWGAGNEICIRKGAGHALQGEFEALTGLWKLWNYGHLGLEATAMTQEGSRMIYRWGKGDPRIFGNDRPWIMQSHLNLTSVSTGKCKPSSAVSNKVLSGQWAGVGF